MYDIILPHVVDSRTTLYFMNELNYGDRVQTNRDM